MEKKQIFNTKTIVGTGLLVAVEVVLQLFSMIVPSAVNINLSLIPITIGAIVYGPTVGFFLGLVSGGIILASPNTVTVFMAISPGSTVVTCLLKTSLAGLLAGLINKLFKEKHPLVGTISASIIVPLINTLIFALMCNFFFLKGLGLSNFWQIFTVLIGINFLFELITNAIICPTLVNILGHVRKNRVDD